MNTDHLQYSHKSSLERFQVDALRKALTYCREHSPYYQRVFEEAGLDPAKFKSLKDLHSYPFTTKEDLQQQADDFLCVRKRDIIDYASTSGTLGSPVIIPSTRADLDRLALNECLSFMVAGVTSDDVMQLMTTMDKRFMAGLAYFLGATRLGAGFIRAGSGLPEMQWANIHQLKPTVLIAVPSFLVKLLDFAERNNIDPNQSSVEKVICIGESFRNEDLTLNALGKRITEKWKVELFGTYASTEMSAAFTECKSGKGGHLLPEITYVEVLNGAGKPVANGEEGEVVFTSLGIEALPLIRYRTGDRCRAYYEPCTCGRNTLRLGPIIGRSQQMIKFKGTSLYPPVIFNALNEIREIENYVVEVSTSDIDTDHLLIRLVCRDASESLKKKISETLRAQLRVLPELDFTDMATILSIQAPDKNRKPIRFLDHRKSG